MIRMLIALSLCAAALIHATPSVKAQSAPAQSTPAQSAPARSGPACAQRGMVIDTLAQKYGETRRSVGLAANNTVMELYANPDTGSWTIAVTMPDGVTCLMASGRGYEAVADELPAKGEPA